jgi:formamidopyrimidine-DNA glycosylase
MATTSEVKSALDGIAEVIAGSISARERAKTLLLMARNQLAGLPTQYADEIAEINGYVPDGAFETLAKDEKARLQTEFMALKNAIEDELDALGVSYT